MLSDGMVSFKKLFTVASQKYRQLVLKGAR